MTHDPTGRTDGGNAKVALDFKTGQHTVGRKALSDVLEVEALVPLQDFRARVLEFVLEVLAFGIHRKQRPLEIEDFDTVLAALEHASHELFRLA